MDFNQPFHPLLWMPIAIFAVAAGWALWERRKAKRLKKKDTTNQTL